MNARGGESHTNEVKLEERQQPLCVAIKRIVNSVFFLITVCRRGKTWLDRVRPFFHHCAEPVLQMSQGIITPFVRCTDRLLQERHFCYSD